ncbi:MAG: hypothetical protein LBJ61_03765 [Deltaproteobacteria bacterium]|jgi:hypothetical protein|nr:hypothetical protein [Deltaproteobacteria bacterium]
MAFFKRRPHIPRPAEDGDGGNRPPTRKSRNKYDDYDSSEGPAGKVVFKRPNMATKGPRAGRDGPPPKRFSKPGPRFRDREEGSGESGGDWPKKPGGFKRGQGGDYGDKPSRGRQGEGPARPYGAGAKKEGSDRPYAAKREGSSRPYGTGSKREGSDRPYGGGAKRGAPSRPYGAGAKREDPPRSFNPVPKPGKASLKASQLLVLRTIVDREIPAALKRLSESEDKCLKVSQNILNHADDLANVKGELAEILADLDLESETQKALGAIGEKCDLISQKINVEASFGDLIGQRLIKITDFLESSLSIFEELIEEHGGAEAAKKAARAKPAVKTAKPAKPSKPGKVGKPAKADWQRDDEFAEDDYAEDDYDHDDYGHGDEADDEANDTAEGAAEGREGGEGEPLAAEARPKPEAPKKIKRAAKVTTVIRESVPAEGAQALEAAGLGEESPKPAKAAKKAAKEKKKALKKEELFGPDDEALTQDEVNDLVSKLFK